MNISFLDPAFTRPRSPQPLAAAVIDAARTLSSATLHEANGKCGALPAAIQAMHPQFRLCGLAVTVHSPGGDNLWLHRALEVARPGDVLVVDVSGAYEYGYWGEIMASAAQKLGLAGLVLNGCARDITLLADIGFPVFARGACIRGTSKDFGARGYINFPLLIGDVVVEEGDLVCGDFDGVVTVKRGIAEDIVWAAQQREVAEARILERIARGERTLDIYGWR